LETIRDGEAVICFNEISPNAPFLDRKPLFCVTDYAGKWLQAIPPAPPT